MREGRILSWFRWHSLRILATAYDLSLAVVAVVFAYAAAFDFRALPPAEILARQATLFVFIYAGCSWAFAVMRGSWRYVSIPEALSIVKASAAAAIIHTVAVFLISRGVELPRSVPVFATLILIAGATTSRLAYRLMMEKIRGFGFGSGSFCRHDGDIRHILVYGANDEAESFIRRIERAPGSGIRVMGIIDDGRTRLSRSIRGVPLLGPLNTLEDRVRRFAKDGTNITEIVMAEPRPDRNRLNEILEFAAAAGVKVMRLPDSTEMSPISNSAIFELKPIELCDLLNRPEVRVDFTGISRLIDGKTVLVTGAGGSIGSELCRQIAAFAPKRMILTDSGEFFLYSLDKELRVKYRHLPIDTGLVDVRDQSRVRHIFREYRPQIVFHAAALKHVPLVEDNPLEGIKTNVLGSRNVANMALAFGVETFVMISTDKAINPTSVMGASKRAAEICCQALDVASPHTRFRTVRFGNVLGSSGSVVPRFQEQIAAGGPITVTHPDMMRYFMTIPEAVRLVLHACAYGLQHGMESGKIVVLDMGEPVRIVDLAKRMIRLAGYRPGIDIDIVFTGLRRGEKLFEEIFSPDEVEDNKTRDGFLMATPRLIDRTLLERLLTDLEAAAIQEDVARAVKILSRIVPEYHPGGGAAGRADYGTAQPGMVAAIAGKLSAAAVEA